MLITGTGAPVSELLEHLIRAGAHTHRGNVPGEHQRRIANRLAAGELELIGAQHHRVAAQLVNADLEGDTGRGRRLLEDQRDA